MKLESRDRQILEHIVKYCAEVQMAIECFGHDKDKKSLIATVKDLSTPLHKL